MIIFNNVSAPVCRKILLAGEGLVTSNGEKWKRHRKMLTQAFHFDILKQYIPVYNEVCNKLLVC